MKELVYFYRQFHLPGHDHPKESIGRFQYLMLTPSACVFTGIDRDTQSTVNGAEDIIKLICREEKLDPRTTSFYDLQTCSGYRNPPGHFEFERLELEFESLRGFHVSAWIDEPCPAEVIKVFAEQIGLNPYQQKNPMDYRPGAYEEMLRHEAAKPKPELRKLFPWVKMEYHEAIKRFVRELAEPYQKYDVTHPEFVALLDALQSCFASGMGRSNFVKVDGQLLLYLASWIEGAIREGDHCTDMHSFGNVVQGFVRTLVRAIRMNEIHLMGDHAFFRGFQLPDWFVGWAFTWHFTPGENGDA